MRERHHRTPHGHQIWCGAKNYKTDPPHYRVAPKGRTCLKQPGCAQKILAKPTCSLTLQEKRAVLTNGPGLGRKRPRRATMAASCLTDIAVHHYPRNRALHNCIFCRPARTFERGIGSQARARRAKRSAWRWKLSIFQLVTEILAAESRVCWPNQGWPPEGTVRFRYLVKGGRPSERTAQV